MPAIRTPSPSPRHALLVIASLAIAVLSCGREPTAPGGGNAGVARRSQALGWIAEFPKGVADFQTAGGAAVAFTKVHIVLNFPPPDNGIALDTYVDFPAGATEIQPTLSVLLPPGTPESGLPLALSLDYQNAAGVNVFHGGPVTVTAVPVAAGGAAPPPSPVTIPITYVGPGATATKVVISPKSANVAMGGGFTFTAQALDAGNAVVPNTPIVFNSGNGSIATVNAATGSGSAGTVRGTTTITAQLLTGPTDVATITVTPIASAIALVSGSGQTGQVNKTLADPLVVRVTAPDGLPVSGVPVNFAASNGGSAASATTDGAGLATTSWKLGTLVGGQSVVASAAGAGSVTFTATAKAADPTKLEFGTQPPTSVVVNGTFGASVRVLDADNQLKSDFTGAVTLAAAGGAGILGGTTSVNAVAGVATFTNLLLAIPGTYTLTASASGPTGVLTPATSTGIVVNPGAVNRVVFTAYPGATTAGVALTPPIVSVRDDAGNVATNFTGPVTLTVATGPAGGALLGTTTVNAVAGVATFSSVTIQVAGSYTITAGAGGATVTGPALQISPGTATGLVVAGGGGQSAIGGSTLPTPVSVKVVDAFGNGVAGSAVTFAPASGSGSVVPTSGVSNSAGLVQTVWTIGLAAGPMTLNASSPGLAPNPLAVLATSTAAGGPGPATQLAFTVQPTGVGTGAAISPSIVVSAKDAGGAVATSFTGNVTLAIGTNPGGGTLSGTLTVAAVAGVATFPGISINNAGTGYTLTATSVPLTAATSAAFNISTTLANAVWTGATNTSWTTASNWSPAVVPATTDSVLINPSANNPVLSGPVTVMHLYLVGTASLSIGTNALTVTGNLDAGHTIISGGGTTLLTGTGTLKGKVNGNVTIGGNYTLAATDTINGNLIVSGGQLQMNGQTLTVSGSLTTSGSGLFLMQNVADSAVFGGNVTFGGGSPALTNGKLIVGGNFSQLSNPTAFAASSPHITRFTGATPTISFNNPNGSFFGTLQFATSGAVTFSTDAKAAGNVWLKTGTTPSIVGPAQFFSLGGALYDTTGGRWQVANTQVGTSGTLPKTMSTNLTFTASALLVDSVTVTGAIDVNGATTTLNMNGHYLKAGTNFSVSSGGKLQMQNVKDSLVILGNATFAGGSETGLITSGTIVLGGTFNAGAGTSFVATGTNQVVLNGAGNQGIIMSGVDPNFAPACTASCFYDLTINKASGWVIVGTDVKATHDITILAVDSLLAASNNVIAGNAALMGGTSGAVHALRLGYGPGGITRAAGFIPDTLVAIGTLTIPLSENIVTITRGTVTLPVRVYSSVVADSGLLVVAGMDTIFTNLVTRNSGTLKTTNAADTLLVKGNVTFGGATPTLTNGVLKVGGNFTQATAATSFVATAPHETHFVDLPLGPISHTVTFANPGFATSRFGTLYFADTLTSLGSDLYADGKLGTRNLVLHHVIAGSDRLITSKGANVQTITFDNVRWMLQDGYTVDNADAVVFKGIIATTLTQFEAQRTGAFSMANFTNWNFQTLPTGGGLYMKATDTDAATNGVFTIVMSGTTPGANGGFVSVVNGAIISGWSNTATWLGGTDINWDNIANWSTGAVPTSSTDVVIPNGTSFQAHTTTATAVNNLTIGSATAVIISGNSLTVNGDLTVTAGGTVNIAANFPLTVWGNVAADTSGTGAVTGCNSGSALNLNGSGKTVTGRFCNMFVSPGSYAANGPVVVDSVAGIGASTGFLSVIGASGNFTVNGNRVRTNKFQTSTSGVLTMTNPSDSLIVFNNATFGGGTETGLLTAGNLVVGGPTFTVSSGQKFDASGTHTTTFNGSVFQTLNWTSAVANKGFNNIRFAGIGGKGFSGDQYIQGNMTCDVSLNTGAVSGSYNIYIGGSLVDNSPLGTGCWSGSTALHFTGNPVGLPAKLGVNNVTFQGGGTTSLTTGLTTNYVTVDGAGTKLKLNGNYLTTNGNTFTTQNGGVLDMTTVNDSLIIGIGQFNGGSTTGLLTQGAIVAQGIATAGPTTTAFAQDSTARSYIGNGCCGSANFATPGFGAAGSHFGTFLVNSGSLITFVTDAFVEGQFKATQAVQNVIGSANRLITARGAVITKLSNTNTRILIVDGQPVTQLDNMNFSGMTGVTQAFLEFQRSGNGASGTIPTMTAPIFNTPPTTGFYIKATDTDAGAPFLTVNVTGTFFPAAIPASFMSANGGAVINWPTVATLTTTGNWNIAGNWSTNVVPDSFSNVSIPNGKTATLTGAGTFYAKDVTVAVGGQIIMATASLEAHGNVVAADTITATRPFTCTTGILYQPDLVVATLSGRVCRYHSGGTITQNGPVVVDSVFHVHDGTFVMNGNTLRTKEAWIGFGNLASGTGALTMNNAQDSLFVSDSLVVGKLGTTASAGTSTITNGYLNVGGKVFLGGVAGSGLFNAAAAHVTDLAGGAKLLKITDTTASGFGTVRVNGSRVLGANTVARVAGNLTLIGGSAVSDTAGQSARWKVGGNLFAGTSSSLLGRAFEIAGALSDSGTFSPDTVVFTGAGQTIPDSVGAGLSGYTYNSIRVTGSATFSPIPSGSSYFLSGKLIADGGQVRIGSGASVSVYVPDSLITKNGGTLKMIDAASSLTAGGDAYFAGGSTTGLLTNGSFTISKDLTQAGTTTSFAPSGSHTTFVQSSSTTDTVTFTNPATSFFNHLTIPSGSTLFLSSDATVNGTLSHGAGLSGIVIKATTGGTTRTLTAAKVLQSGISSPATFSNVAFAFLGGVGSTFDNVNWTNFPGAFTGSLLTVSGGNPFTFTSHSFAASGITPSASSHYLNLAGSANLTMSSATPSAQTLGTGYVQTSTGIVTWP